MDKEKGYKTPIVSAIFEVIAIIVFCAAIILIGVNPEMLGSWSIIALLFSGCCNLGFAKIIDSLSLIAYNTSCIREKLSDDDSYFKV